MVQNVYEDPGNVHIVMELCVGGGILDRIRDTPFTEKQVAYIVRSVLRFVAQCHAKGIIYRDIKPDNFIFLDKSAASPVRATDFGLSIRQVLSPSVRPFPFAPPPPPSAEETGESLPILVKGRGPHGIAGPLIKSRYTQSEIQ